MSTTREQYTLFNANCYNIRNRNETRVIATMAEVIEERGLGDLPERMLRDAYAYALNQLPARYTQQGTIVLREPVKSNLIRQVVVDALETVQRRPKS